MTVDEVLDSFVLDYDLVNKRFDLTVDSNLIRKCKEIKSKHKKKVMSIWSKQLKQCTECYLPYVPLLCILPSCSMLKIFRLEKKL